MCVCELQISYSDPIQLIIGSLHCLSLKETLAFLREPCRSGPVLCFGSIGQESGFRGDMFELFVVRYPSARPLALPGINVPQA